MLEENQEDSGLQLKDYLPRVYRRRWWVFCSVFAAWLLATMFGWYLPPKYRSETLILVEQQKVPEHYVEPNVAADVQQRLQSMSEQILSRTRLLGIVEKFQLYPKVRAGADGDRVLAQMRKDIQIDLVKPAGAGELSAFKISYSYGNPFIAQQVTGELTSLFIDENLRSRAQLSENTTEFLENELDQARKNLGEQEQRLREFRSQYLGQLPEQLQGNVQILNGLQSQLQSATDALDHAEQQQAYLQSVLGQYRSLTGGPAKPGEEIRGVTPPTLDEKIEKLKGEVAELSTKYTPQHPDVRRAQGELAAAEALRTKMRKDSAGGTTANADTRSMSDLQSLSPMLQVQGQLKANELEITRYKQKVKGLEQQIDEYRSRLNLTPIREQQLAAITRDHEQSRTYYESLLAKKLQSEMATNLEKRQQGEQFRMIDPPNLPQRPYSPNRLMFSLAGLAAGLMLGLALVALLEFAEPRIYREEELSSSTGMTVLTCVPPLLTQKEQRRNWRLRIFEGATASLLVAAIATGTLFVYYKG